MITSADKYLKLINDALAALPLHGRPQGLYDPIIYSLQCGGKRIRPTLTLAVGQTLGADIDALMPVALAVEIFHNFTLLHDDIMDHSPLRRGRQTVYVKWNEPTAILSGDAMLTFASQTLMTTTCTNLRQLLETFNHAAMRVYQGQQFDMEFETRSDVTVDEYLEMISGKTSALLAGACSLGAIAANADDTTVEAFHDYGHNIGQAFQLCDDLLDSFGDEATFGKPIGGDIVNDKKTWLMLTAMAEAPQAIAKAKTIADNQQKIAAVREIYNSLDLVDRCRQQIDLYTDRAITAINSLAIDDDAKLFFNSLALRLGGRDK